MTLKTVSITFGGLCMLVQRTKEKQGLYVLMPKVSDAGHQHCPLFVCGKDFNEADKVGIEHLTVTDAIDLSGLATGRVTRIDRIANVSKFDGGRRVDKRCFAANAHPDLAARVILPLPPSKSSAIDPVGKSGAFKVPSAAGYLPRRLNGMLTIHYDVTNPEAWNRMIKGTQMKRNATHLEFAFLNVRPKDLMTQKSYIHRKGYPWGHARAYYSLLEGSIGPDGPPVLINENGGTDEDGHDHTKCIDIKLDEWPPKLSRRDGEIRILFIDPYTCTLGGGCPPGEDC